MPRQVEASCSMSMGPSLALMSVQAEATLIELYTMTASVPWLWTQLEYETVTAEPGEISLFATLDKFTSLILDNPRILFRLQQICYW